MAQPEETLRILPDEVAEDEAKARSKAADDKVIETFKQEIDGECQKWISRLDELKARLAAACVGPDGAACDVHVDPATGIAEKAPKGAPMPTNCQNVACMIDQQAGQLRRYNDYAKSGVWRGTGNASEPKPMASDDYKELLEHIQKFSKRQIEGVAPASGQASGVSGIKDFVEQAENAAPPVKSPPELEAEPTPEAAQETEQKAEPEARRSIKQTAQAALAAASAVAAALPTSSDSSSGPNYMMYIIIAVVVVVILIFLFIIAMVKKAEHCTERCCI
jgi:hypothetical protein